MSKGKAHKRYEFGTQVSITTTRDSKIMVGAMAFDSNTFDGHTLPEVLLQLKRLNALNPAVGLCDRGYKGRNTINDTRILRPGTTTRDTDSAYQALMRKRFRKRAVACRRAQWHLVTGQRSAKSASWAGSAIRAWGGSSKVSAPTMQGVIRFSRGTGGWFQRKSSSCPLGGHLKSQCLHDG